MDNNSCPEYSYNVGGYCKPIKKTSAEWMEEFPYLIIADPDGWDRSNYEHSFRVETISYQEFQRRVQNSTVLCNSHQQMESRKEIVRKTLRLMGLITNEAEIEAQARLDFQMEHLERKTLYGKTEDR